MRRPSPAFVIACIALFVSLGGVGAAAVSGVLTSKALQAYIEIKGQTKPNGTLASSNGGGVTVKHTGTGTYELANDTDPYKDGETPIVLLTPYDAPNTDQGFCDVTSDATTASGFAKVGVACFTIKSGRMAPVDMAFSFDIEGPPATAK